MDSPQNTIPTAILSGWKDIARYLGKGVRTVQRYEHEHRLPVRRVQGKPHGAVIALTEDLEEWLRRTPLHEIDSDRIRDLRVRHLLQKHQEAMSAFQYNLQALAEQLAEARRIRNRTRWFGQKHDETANQEVSRSLSVPPLP